MGIVKAARRRWKLRRAPIEYARGLGVTIGDDCRILGLRSGTFGSEPYLIQIGDHVTITGGVQFITHDGGVWVFRLKQPELDVFGDIIIGSNVFIGYGTILMPGARIGDNVVVGAGSIVKGTIPSDCVVAGTPARVIKTLDQYHRQVEAAAFNIRSRSASTKRSILQSHFRGN